MKDSHGNVRNLVATTQEQLRWDVRDSLGGVDRIGGGVAFYAYAANRQRTRKRIERSNVNLVEDRLYLGGLELARKYRNGALVEEVESLHLVEGDQRVLLVDDVITREGAPATVTLQRYQYGNHLQSVGMELDDQAALVSYEEYHPYGTTAYRALRDAVEVPPKRYRYTGMERDEESGLCCHGARYYAPWLGRWTAADPIDVRGGANLFEYADGSPIANADRAGTQTGSGSQTPPVTTGTPNTYQNLETDPKYIREHYAPTGTVKLKLKATLRSLGVSAAATKRILAQTRGNTITGLVRKDVAAAKTLLDNQRTAAAKLPGYDETAEFLQAQKDTKRVFAAAGATPAEIEGVVTNTKAGYAASIRAEAIITRAVKAGQPIPQSLAKALRTPVAAPPPTTTSTTPKANVVTFAPKAKASTGGGSTPSANVSASTEAETPPGVIKGGAAAEKRTGGGGGGGGGSGAGTATIVGTMLQVALPSVVGDKISGDAMQVVTGVIQAGAEWVETVGPAQALTGLTVAGTMIGPKVGLAVGAVGSSVGTAFGATTLGGIAAGGAGAVAVAAGAVVVAGVAGYAIGTGINKAMEASGITAFHENMMEKLGVYDLSYRLFFK
jgi:RHS repeat-associated protein